MSGRRRLEPAVHGGCEAASWLTPNRPRCSARAGLRTGPPRSLAIGLLTRPASLALRLRSSGEARAPRFELRHRFRPASAGLPDATSGSDLRVFNAMAPAARLVRGALRAWRCLSMPISLPLSMWKAAVSGQAEGVTEGPAAATRSYEQRASLAAGRAPQRATGLCRHSAGPRGHDARSRDRLTCSPFR